MMLRSTVALVAAVGAAVADFPQMNDDVKYVVSNPAPNATKAMKFHGKNFFHVDSTHFKSQYSQVGAPTRDTSGDTTKYAFACCIGVGLS